MSKKSKPIRQEITIQELYPNQPPERLREAEENLMAYLEVISRLHEWLCADPVAYAQFKALTDLDKRSTIR